MNLYTKSTLADLGSSYVECDMDQIEEWTNDVYDHDFELPGWRAPLFISDLSFPNFLGVSNAINYCFTDFSTGEKFDVEYKGEIYRGSYAMAASIKRAMDEGIPILSAGFLSKIDIKKAKNIFRYVTTPIPLIDERVKSLRNVGKVLIGSGLWNFTKLFQLCDYWAFNQGCGIVEKLVGLFESYNDVAFYKGHYLNFAKRAQLVAMMYYGRSNDSLSLKPLKDPYNIGPISDYVVPAVLNRMGILSYTQELTDIISTERVIPKESVIEIEIRKFSIEAMLELLKCINIKRAMNSMKAITMAELDFWVWSAIRSYKEPIRHHYTYTTAY